MTVAEESHRRLTQCVVIDANRKSSTPPPPNCTIPFNENSTRALSKKNRVYVLREFLHRNYPSCIARGRSTVLDVAGGKGDLSWILRNIDGIDSVIADPRIPNHRRMVRSVKFLLDYPEEAAIRSVEGVPTHQPLAKLLPRLLANLRGTIENDDGFACKGENNCRVDLQAPQYLRMHVDDRLVETLRQILVIEGEVDSRAVWDGYWKAERCRIESNTTHYGGTVPKASAAVKMNDKESRQIVDPRSALEVFRSLDLIVGFHPDQATEATIDLALLSKIPFAVVPCCVFPSEFPDRIIDGKRVRNHGEFIEYLCAKHPQIKREKLPFVETDTAKNVVLYMMKEDFI
eukprot:CAMPEP_0181091966 /NCGR_PEP_ID=MMETSP1071-20121207/8675_1 /TAXON_ID=35127 /ORGANISM="Thalassiosira sp., Strain NH16" /LENGTH=344 /DNA_ID=CAMNT_0023174131 /DNA_START=88 /DNA_END=1122 /DNA_ORIENTATION=+